MEALIIVCLVTIILLLIWVFKLKKNIKEYFIAEHDLLYESEHDALTGLANGTLVIDRLKQSMKNARRYKNQIAVVYLGLDNFKEMNNSVGSDICDEVLQTFAAKLLKTIRQSDTVSRIGGDEFIIILDHFENAAFIRSVVDKIMQISKEPMTIQSHKLDLTFSLGVSVYPDDSNDSTAILNHASTAMHTVKSEGRDGYRFYTAELEDEARKRGKFERDLSQSLENNEMEIYYQLQIDSKTTSILGMEALMRWNHPQMGMILPEQFLPVAESLGFVIDLEEWLMHTSITDFEQWHKEGLQTGNLSLNLSVKRLQKEGFMRSLGNLMNRNTQLHDYLCFELTENEIMREPEKYTQNLGKLSRLGFKLSLDHFGLACTSISHISGLFLYGIKIDSSLIKDSTNNPQAVQAIIALAKNFKLDVTAVGVETKEQLQFLAQNNCTSIQGNIYHKAAPADSITRILKDRASK